MKGVIYQGPPVSDAATFGRLPLALRGFLLQCNGLVAYQGGLHVRGCCRTPAWHSLRAAWEGAAALHARYAAVRPTDVPFAEDYAGHQFLLRGEEVVFLDAETGETAYLCVGFEQFIAGIEKFPRQALGLELLVSYLRGGGHLRPGELLSVQPPQCVAAPGRQRTLRPQPTAERLAFLASFYQQIKDADGSVRRRDGRPDYRWQKALPPITSETEARLVREGKLKPEETHFLPLDASGKAVTIAGGSVHWNAHRKRWIGIFGRKGGERSFLGEIVYAEADAPTGPFRRAVRVCDHPGMTFYNPVQHAFLDRGSKVYFEGTYTAEFSGNKDRTPRYDYNQLMYRLDLDDPRLAFARGG